MTRDIQEKKWYKRMIQGDKLRVRLSQIFITDVKGFQPHICLSSALTVQIYNKTMSMKTSMQFMEEVEDKREEQKEEDEDVVVEEGD